jgi:hypothetical protein
MGFLQKSFDKRAGKVDSISASMRDAFDNAKSPFNLAFSLATKVPRLAINLYACGASYLLARAIRRPLNTDKLKYEP